MRSKEEKFTINVGVFGVAKCGKTSLIESYIIISLKVSN